MSVRYGTKKMSKSDASNYSHINLTDDPDTIAEKVRKVKTDPEPLPTEERGLDARPEADNLVGIYAALAGRPKADVGPNSVGAWQLGDQQLALGAGPPAGGGARGFRRWLGGGGIVQFRLALGLGGDGRAWPRRQPQGGRRDGGVVPARSASAKVTAVLNEPAGREQLDLRPSGRGVRGAPRHRLCLRLVAKIARGYRGPARVAAQTNRDFGRGLGDVRRGQIVRVVIGDVLRTIADVLPRRHGEGETATSKQVVEEVIAPDRSVPPMSDGGLVIADCSSRNNDRARLQVEYSGRALS